MWIGTPRCTGTSESLFFVSGFFRSLVIRHWSCETVDEWFASIGIKDLSTYRENIQVFPERRINGDILVQWLKLKVSDKKTKKEIKMCVFFSLIKPQRRGRDRTEYVRTRVEGIAGKNEPPSLEECTKPFALALLLLNSHTELEGRG